jgi:hypothetical protein
VGFGGGGRGLGVAAAKHTVLSLTGWLGELAVVILAVVMLL